MSDPSRSSAPHLVDPAAYDGALNEWGEIPTMIEGHSHTTGLLLHKHPDGSSECGIWQCTPGLWTCHVTRDELCHFLWGRCTYTHESGEVIEIVPNTAAFFPAGWRGVSTPASASSISLLDQVPDTRTQVLAAG